MKIKLLLSIFFTLLMIISISTLSGTCIRIRATDPEEITEEEWKKKGGDKLTKEEFGEYTAEQWEEAEKKAEEELLNEEIEKDISEMFEEDQESAEEHGQVTEEAAVIDHLVGELDTGDGTFINITMDINLSTGEITGKFDYYWEVAEENLSINPHDWVNFIWKGKIEGTLDLNTDVISATGIGEIMYDTGNTKEAKFDLKGTYSAAGAKGKNWYAKYFNIKSFNSIQL
jgi:predicted Holliday junction resolvase-like endonuclease